MNYLDRPKENWSIANTHHHNIIDTIRKWNDANEGATTEELKSLERSLTWALRDVQTILSLRKEDEKL